LLRDSASSKTTSELLHALHPTDRPTLARLAQLKPRTLATMHGSTFTGNGAQAIRDLAAVLKEILGAE